MATAGELDGVLVVDKARGPTSHDVVAVARRALGTRAIGHTGTLDPMATGVLVLVIGEATKLVGALGGLAKHYDATIRLGVATSTLDADGEVTAHAEVPKLTRADVEGKAAAFLGVRDQEVPLVSAVKRDGRPLYKHARAGTEVALPVRRVRLDAIEIGRIDAEAISLSLACGTGFYVRALARDLCTALGTVGHLTQLRRTRNGAFDAAEAVSFDALRAAREDEGRREALRARVVPLREICRALPHLALDDVGVAHARQGRRVPLENVVDGGPPTGDTLVALDGGGEPVALVERLPEHLRIVRGFRAR